MQNDRQMRPCPKCGATSFKSIPSLEDHVQRCLDDAGSSSVNKAPGTASQNVVDDYLVAAATQQQEALASHLQGSPHFCGGTAEDLEAWLRDNLPSAYNSAQGGYIYIDDCSGLRRLHALPDGECYSEEDRVDRLVGEWQRLEHEAQVPFRLSAC